MQLVSDELFVKIIDEMKAKHLSTESKVLRTRQKPNPEDEDIVKEQQISDTLPSAPAKVRPICPGQSLLLKSDTASSRVKLDDQLIFDAMHKAYPEDGMPSDIEQRYKKLKAADEEVTGKTVVYHASVDLPDTEVLQRPLALNSFKSLFCRRCHQYDCLLHSKEMDVPSDKAATIVIRPRKDFKEVAPPSENTCALRCHKKVEMSADRLPTLMNSQVTLLRCNWPSMAYDYCNLTRIVNLAPAGKRQLTCAEIAAWCQHEFGGKKPQSPMKNGGLHGPTVNGAVKKKKKKKSAYANLANAANTGDGRLKLWQKLQCQAIARNTKLNVSFFLNCSRKMF